MTEKIKNAIQSPSAIPISVGIISLTTAILALIFNYLPPQKELSASPIKDACEYRVGVVEDRCDKIESTIYDLDTKLNLVIEILQGKKKK